MGGEDEGLVSKCFWNTATGVITGGLKAGIGMFTASLLPARLMLNFSWFHRVCFHFKSSNLPYDDPSLIKEGARIVIESNKGTTENFSKLMRSNKRLERMHNLQNLQWDLGIFANLNQKVENSGDVGK